MSMKKILMAAVAVSALTAGAASAASITVATLNGADVYNVASTPAATPYKLANETKIPVAGLATSAGTIKASVVSGRLGVGTYTVTYDLSGPAGFTAALTNGSIAGDHNLTGTGCVVTPALVSGGLLGGKTVTYSVSVSGTCAASGTLNSAPQNFTLSSPITVTGFGDVSATASFAQGGVTIDNGAAAARTLLTNAAGFTATASADTVATQFALAGTPAYTALQTGGSYDAVIGKYTIAGSASVFVDAAGLAAASAQNLTADISLAGDFTYLTGFGTVGTIAWARATPYTAITAAGTSPVTDQAITLAVTGSASASQTSKAFSLTVTPKTTTPLVYTVPSAFTTAMQSIGLQGTNYLAPWVGGSQSSAATSIRLSNSGVATGAVTVQLLAPVYDAGTTAGATTCTSSTLSKLSSIATNSELVIANADLTTCFGNFKRGDVVVTIQADPTALTAKARNVNAGTGVVSEISLGAS